VPARAQCLKFETDQAQDVKRLEKLNTLFFSYMCGKDPHADTELDGALSPTQRTVRTLTRRTVLALAGGKSRLQHAACACAIAQPNAARARQMLRVRLAARQDDSTHARAHPPARPPSRAHTRARTHTPAVHIAENMGSPKPSSAGGVGQKSDRDRRAPPSLRPQG